MNYTAAIRQYIQDHPTDLFDVQYIQTNLYPLIDYRTILKIFDRLVAEGLIVKLDRGIFAPVSALPEGFYIDTYDPHDPSPAIEQLVLDYYTDDTNGIVLENAVYTNRLPSDKNKTVCSVKLTGADIVFDESAKKLVSLLNLIENHLKFPDYSLTDYAKTRDDLFAAVAPDYSEELLLEIVSTFHFQAGTVSNFFNLLDQADITHSILDAFMWRTQGKNYSDFSSV